MSNFTEKFNSANPAVSINAYGLIFNTVCIQLLGSPEFVAIGVDRKENKLAIKPLKSDKKAFRCYPYNEGGKNQLIVRSTKLLNEINKLKIKIKDDVAYPAIFNQITGIIVVDLNI